MTKEDIIKIVEEHKDKLIGDQETKEMVISVAKHFISYLQNFNGRSSLEFAAAMTFLAYRKMKMPILAKEISEIFDVEIKEIFRCYKRIKRKLGMHPCKMSSLLSKKCIISFKPEDFVERFGKELNLSPKTIKDAKKMIKKAEDRIKSVNPKSISAGALYVAARMNEEKRTQRECGDVAGISEVTVRNIYQEIIEQAGLKEKFIIKEEQVKNG